jgi:hypothetical protein
MAKNRARKKPNDLKKVPTNIALKPQLIKRVRVVAARNLEQVTDVMERLILAGIIDEELQAEANQNARPNPR